MDPLAEIAKMTKQMEKEQGLNGGTNFAVSEAEIDDLLKDIYSEIGKPVPKKGEPAQAIVQKPDPAAEAMSLAVGKDKFLEGQKLAQLAVNADKELSFGTAAVNYDKALECFAAALNNGFPRAAEKRTAICSTMLNYLDRLQQLIIEFADPSLGLKESTETVPARKELNKNRRDIMTAMAKVNFQALSRGVDIRKRAKIAEDKGVVFVAYVLYAESLDCFMTYMSLCKDKEKNERLMSIVMETLETAETLKKKI